MELSDVDFGQYPAEGHRIYFYFRRDGFDATVKAVAQTYIIYRLALKRGIAKNKLSRRSYVESCIDQRRFLRAYAPVVFKNTLTSIFCS